MSKSHSTTPTWHKYAGAPDTDTAMTWPKDQVFAAVKEHFDRFMVVSKPGADNDKAPTKGFSSSNTADAYTAWSNFEQGFNVGVQPDFDSHMAIVDADATGDMAAFEAFVRSTYGFQAHATVRSPGKYKPGTEELKPTHNGGGHYWCHMPVPVHELFPADANGKRPSIPTTPGERVQDKDTRGGFDVVFAKKFCMAPPSRRTEGPYKLVLVDGTTAVNYMPPTFITDVLIHTGKLDADQVKYEVSTPQPPLITGANLRIIESILFGDGVPTRYENWSETAMRNSVVYVLESLIKYNYAVSLYNRAASKPLPYQPQDLLTAKPVTAMEKLGFGRHPYTESELQQDLCDALAHLEGAQAPGKAMASVRVRVTVDHGKQGATTWGSTAPVNPFAQRGAAHDTAVAPSAPAKAPTQEQAPAKAQAQDTPTAVPNPFATQAPAQTQTQAPAQTQAQGTAVTPTPAKAPAKAQDTAADTDTAVAQFVYDDEDYDTGYDGEFADTIDEWTRSVSWDELLTDWDAGWQQTGTESCGCAVYQHPTASSRRSAVAHDAGCQTGHSIVLNMYSTTDQNWTFTRGENNAGGAMLSKFDLLCNVIHQDTDEDEDWVPVLATQQVFEYMGLPDPYDTDDDDDYADLPGWRGTDGPTAPTGQPPAKPTLTLVGGTDTVVNQAQAPAPTAQAPTAPTTASTTAVTTTPPAAPAPQAPTTAVNTAQAERDVFGEVQAYCTGSSVVQQGKRKFLRIPGPDSNYPPTVLNQEQVTTVANVIAMMVGAGVTITADTVQTITMSAAQDNLTDVESDLWPEGYPATPERVRKIMDASPYTRWVYWNCVLKEGVTAVNPVTAYFDALTRASMMIPATVKVPTGGPSTMVPTGWFNVATGPSGSGKTQAQNGRGFYWAQDTRTFNELPVINDDRMLMDATTPQQAVVDKFGMHRIENPVVTFPEGDWRNGELGNNMVRPRQNKGFMAPPVNWCTLGGMSFSPASGESIAARLSREYLIKRHPEDQPEGTDDKDQKAAPFIPLSDAAPNAVALLNIPEMAVFVKTAGRSGNTLDVQLLNAYVGEEVGTDTKDDNRSLSGDYSVSMRGTAQPVVYTKMKELAGDNGLVQRITFNAAEWPMGNCDIGVTPPPAGVLDGTERFVYPAEAFAEEGNAFKGFTMCQKAYTETRRNLFKGVKDIGYTPDADTPLYHRGVAKEQLGMFQHGPLMAVKLACSVAVLHGTSHISEAVWAHVGDLMEYYRRTVVGLEAQAKAHKTAANHELGASQYEVEQGKAAAKQDANKKKAATRKSVKNALIKHGPLTEGGLKNKITASRREHIPDALVFLHRNQEIIKDPNGEYRINPNTPQKAHA